MSRLQTIGGVGLTTLLSIVSVVLIGLLAAGGPPGSNVDVARSRLAAHAPNEILIRFQETASAEERDRIRAELGGQSVRRLGSSVELRALGSGYTTETAIERYGDHLSVRYVEPNYLVYAERLPDDPLFPELYGLRNTGQTGGTPGADIDAERAWDITTGSRDVIVAVLDTGVDYTHPDLVSNIWTNPGEIPDNGLDDDGNGYVDDVRGWDFVNDDHDPRDDNHHGTHVAGTIGASGDNAVGMTGVSWKVSIVPIKVLNQEGQGTTADIIAGLEYATTIGASITNNSWGGAPFSQALLDTILAAPDLLFVASAGNDATDTDRLPHYPSGYESPNIVSVGAVNQYGLLQESFSNYGAESVDLAAPGAFILSAFPGERYAQLSGTSMAAPHVSGTAALIRSVAPNIGAVALKQVILDNVQPTPALEGITVTGGRLNASLALAARDAVPPSAVDDLAVESSTSNSVVLRWTAPGDDGDSGRVARYEIRYSTVPFDEETFETATPVAFPPAPGDPGTAERFEVPGLQSLTAYHFAIRAIDDWGNAGHPGNVAFATTLPSPTFASSPDSFDVTLFTGLVTSRALTLSNVGVGTLDWHAAESSPWLTVAPVSGRLFPGESTELTLAIDARGLDSRAFDASIDVQTNDPRTPLVGHPVRLLVLGASAIDVHPAALEFGQVFLGTSLTLPLEIRNVGTESLDLLELAVGAPEFRVTSGATTVPAGATTIAEVTLTPTESGRLTSTLTIRSDAPNAPVLEIPLAGSAAPPPKIGVSPSRLDDTLLTGQAATHLLTLVNSGASDLIVTLAFEDFLGPVKTTASPILVNGGFETGDFTGWTATTNHPGWPFSWDVSRAGEGYFVNSSPFEGSFNAHNAVDGVAGLTFDLTQTFAIPPDVFHAELSYRDRIQFDGLGAFNVVPRLYEAAIEDPDGTILARIVREEIRIDQAHYHDLGWRRRSIDLLPFAGQTARLHIRTSAFQDDSSPAQIEFDDFRIDLHGFPKWLSARPTTATIPSGQTVQFEVTLDAGESGSASFEGALRISSNDPELPAVTVPVTLTVSGVPGILVSGPRIDLSSTVTYSKAGAITHHEFPLTTPPSAGGGITVAAEGDFGSEFEFASVLVEERAVGAIGRVGDECGTAEGEFFVDPPEMTRLAADRVVRVEVHNMLYVDPICPQNEHNVVFSYRGEAGRIDFETVPVGTSPDRSILIENRGAGPLEIYSIAADAADFETSHTALSVAPGDAERVGVTFTPSAIGPVSATLIILSNDPDTPRIDMELAGVGGIPPEITVDPLSIDATLAIGAAETQTLALSNSGDIPLEFEISLDLLVPPTEPPRIDLLSPSPTPLTCIVGDPERGHIYAQEDDGTAFYRYDAASDAWEILARAPVRAPSHCGAALLNDKIYTAYELDSRLGIYDIADDSWTTTVAPVGFTNNIASDGRSSIYQVRELTTTRLDLSSGLVDGLAIPPFEFDAEGGSGHLDGVIYGHRGGGTAGFAAYDIETDAWTMMHAVPGWTHPGGAIDPYSREYLAYGNQKIFRYSIDDDAWTAWLTPFEALDDGGLAWLANPPAVYFPEGQRGTGFARLRTSPTFVRVNPGEGVVPPLGNTDLEVVLSAAGITAGTHSGEIEIISDDPDTPRTSVPVRLTVVGTPDISVVGERLTVQSTRAYASGGATTRHVLLISALAGDDVRLELIADGDFGGPAETAVASSAGALLGSVGHTRADCTAAMSAFSVGTEALLAIVEDDHVEIDVANTPEVGSFCDSNSHLVRLSYRVSAERVDFGNTLTGLVRERSVVIRNGGTGPLRVAAITSDLVEFSSSTTAAEIGPGQSRQVQLRFAPAAVGRYDGTLSIRSDDPDTPTIEISLSGAGIEPPVIGVTPEAIDVTLPRNAREDRMLTLFNTGAGPLEFSLDVVPSDSGFLSLQPASGAVPPGGAIDVRVGFDATDTSMAVHVAEILVVSNDPETPVVHVPVSLEVSGAPRIALHGEPVVIESFLDFLRREETTLHELPVVSAPVGSGAIELVADGDFGEAGEEATAIAEGLFLGAVNNLGRDCSPGSDTFAVAAAELALLVADGVVEVEVQNNSNVGVCPTNRHTVRLHYTEALDHLDFGGPPVGLSLQKTILVENTGATDLEIYSVTSDAPEFVPVVQDTRVAPDETTTVTVTFTPPSASTFAGTLRLETNDPERPRAEVPLSGAGTDRAEISIEPAVFELTLLRGEQVSRPLQVSNHGYASLELSLAVADPATSSISFEPASEIVPPLDSRIVTVRFDATDLPLGSHNMEIEARTNDPVDPVLRIPVYLTVVGKPRIRVGASPLVLESSRDYFSTGATTVHDFLLPAPPSGSAVVELTVNGDYGEWTETAAIFIDGTQRGEVPGQGSDCRSAVFTFPLSAAEFATAAVDGRIEFSIRNSRDVGTLCATNNHTVRLRYSGQLEHLDFGTVALGASRSLFWIVENSGTDRLEIASITSDSPEFSTQLNDRVIRPGESRSATTFFEPSAPGPFDAILSLASNDPDAPLVTVRLAGTGAAPAAIDVNPSALDETLQAGETIVRSLTLSNDGGVPLDYLFFVDSEAGTWLSADPSSGTNPIGASRQVSLRFDATELVAGTVQTVVRITSNDPARPAVDVPVALHVVGTPTISVDPTTLDFGTVLTGFQAELPVVIENRGAATLEIESILSDVAECTSEHGALSLAPHSSQTVTITFAPRSVGSSEGTLRISSNDPSSPVIEVPLSGAGAEPSVMGLEPLALDVSVPAGGSTTRALTISNSGGSPLEFSVSPILAFPSPLFSSFGVVEEFELLTSSAVPLTCVVADPGSGFLYAQADQGTAFYRYSAASDTWEELASAPVHSGNGGGAALLDGKIYTSYTGQSWLGVYDIADNSWGKIPSPLPSTANIASDGAGYIYLVLSNFGRKLDPLSGAVFALEPSPISFSQWAGLRHVDGVLYAHQGGAATGFAAYDIATESWNVLPPLPTAGGLGATIDGAMGRYVAYGHTGISSLYGYATETGTWESRTIPFFAVENGGVAWLPDPASATYVVQGRQGTGLARVVSRPRFLGVEPRSGSVPPAQSARIDVSLDGTDLPVGTYEASIVLSSNDPTHRRSDVPVVLSVTAAPNLRVLGASGAIDRIDFGRAFVGSAQEISLTVENNGTELLEIASVTTSTPIFSSSLASTSLAPGASEMLTLGFHPPVAAPFSGTLRIVSNDPGSPVFDLPLTGTGVEHDSIEPVPDSFEVALPEGARATRTLEIANHGNSAVELVLVVEPSTATFVTPVPPHLTVQPSETIQLDLGLDTTELGVGAHVATVRIESIEPEALLARVPVTLTVYGAPDIVVGGDPVVLTSSGTFTSSGAQTQHRLSVVTPSSGPGHLELVAEGDFGLPAETATLDAEGMLFGPVGAAGPDCTAVSESFVVDPRSLRRIAADGLVEIGVRNNPQVDPICSSNRHAVTLGYHAPADLIEFGDVAVGANHSRDITLFNVGTEELVVSSIAVADPQFGSSVAATRLSAGASETVTLSFAPSNTGEVRTSLVIASNDEDSSELIIPVTARGTDPPVIQASPVHLSSVLTRGEREMQSLTLSNVGGSALEFEISLPDVPFLEVSPTSGTLAPGETFKVYVIFETTAVAPGRYEATLNLASNDPANPAVEITTRLDHLGRPDFAIAGKTVELTSVVGYSTHGAGTDHVLEVPVSPAGAGRFELVAGGDFGLPIETATLSVEGQTLGAVGGMRWDCIPASGSFFVSPNDLERMTADGVVHAHVQNDSHVNVSCADLHTVRLFYDSAVERIDFGTVFVGSARAEPLSIRNDGFGELEISSITSELSDVTASPTALTVAESGTGELVVIYSPTSAGPLTATLEFLTNDPDESRVTLEIVGNAVDPPVAEVVPPLIVAASPVKRDSVRRKSLWLRNEGGSELLWSAQAIAPIDAPAGSSGYRFRDSDDPDGPIFDWQDISTTGSVVPLTGDDESWGPIPIGFDFPFYGSVFGEINVCSNGWISFSSAETSFSNPESLPDDGILTPENLIAPFWDDLDLHGSTSIRYSGDQTRVVVQYTAIDRHTVGSEFTFQVILYPSGEIVYQYLTMSGTLDSATIGIQNGEKNAGLLVAYNEDYVHDRLAVALSPTARWVTIDRSAGSVAPGESTRIRVDLDPAGLGPGRHRSEIVIHSNDPLHPVISVPVHLWRPGHRPR